MHVLSRQREHTQPILLIKLGSDNTDRSHEKVLGPSHCPLAAPSQPTPAGALSPSPNPTTPAPQPSGSPRGTRQQPPEEHDLLCSWKHTTGSPCPGLRQEIAPGLSRQRSRARCDYHQGSKGLDPPLSGLHHRRSPS